MWFQHNNAAGTLVSSPEPSSIPPIHRGGILKDKNMKKSLLKLAALVVAVLGAGAAQAGTNVGRWTVGLGGLWANTDSDRGLDDGASIDLSAGYAATEKRDFGLNMFASNHDRIGCAGESAIRGVTFDFDRVFSGDARISPCILLGAGIIDQYRPGIGIADKEVVARFGGGALADLLEFGGGHKFQVKLEAAARNSIGRQITDITLDCRWHLALAGINQRENP
jgi:hypothetical protein